MAKDASAAAVRPVRLDVRPVAQGTHTGEEVQVEVQLRDNFNRPVPATATTPVRVTMTTPSGAHEVRQITFKPGESSQTVKFLAREAGPNKLMVKHPDDYLLDGSNYVLIRPGNTKAPLASDTPRRPVMKFRLLQMESNSPAAYFQPALYQRTAAAVPAAATAPASLMLLIAGEHDNEVRANGKAYSRVQVFYTGETPLRTPVKVFLTPSEGSLSEAFVTVDPGSGTGEVHWTSTVIAREAKVRVVQVVPDTLTISPTEAGTSFVEPILGVKLVNPPESISLVDNPSLTARFFDDNGNAVSTTVKRRISFVSSNPILRVSPEEDEVSPDHAEFRTLLQPASWGSSTIEVATPGYQPASHPIQVTVLTILLLCVMGGLLGGAASHWNANGGEDTHQLLIRLAGGVIVALAASWVYVFIGVPKLESGIAHTQISVLFVSLFAAFAGLGAIKALGKVVGLGV